MRFPINTYRGEGTSPGKYFQLNVITSLIWFLFFWNSDFSSHFSHMLPLFQDNFISGEATSSHFFRVTNSTQQLLFRGSYFLITAAAAFFSFFRRVTFSQEVFFQNSFFIGAELLQISHFLRTGSSLRKLLFGTVIFFGGTALDKDI